MIKINLASSASTKAAIPPLGASVGGIPTDGLVDQEQIRKEALKRLLVIFLGPLGFYAYEMQNIPSKMEVLNSKRQVLTELEAYNEKAAASVAEIKKFKEDEALIEARIAALEKIGKDRLKEVQVMDLLQTVIPEKAWLNRIQINPTSVNIQGTAMSDFEVSSFLDSLTRSVFLIDVNLVSSSEFVQDGVNFKKFEITCLLERPNE